MSPETPDAATPPPAPRTFSRATLIGLACFAAGLLLVAGGVILVVHWFLSGTTASILVGLLLVLVGIATNITGLMRLYRGVVRPGSATGNDDRNP
jgi:hypothetical protein